MVGGVKRDWFAWLRRGQFSGEGPCHLHSFIYAHIHPILGKLNKKRTKGLRQGRSGCQCEVLSRQSLSTLGIAF